MIFQTSEKKKKNDGNIYVFMTSFLALRFLALATKTEFKSERDSENLVFACLKSSRAIDGGACIMHSDDGARETPKDGERKSSNRSSTHKFINADINH